MGGLVLAAGGSDVDIVARIVGIAGLVVSAGTALLTWHLWKRSGPALHPWVSTKRFEGVNDDDKWGGDWELEGAFITNSGRMPVVVSAAWLTPVKPDEGAGEIWPLMPKEGKFPLTIPPTGSCEAVLISEARPKHWPSILEVRAVVQRGDGRNFEHGRIRARVPPLPPGPDDAPRP